MAEERTIQWWKDAIKNGLKFQEDYAHSQFWPSYKAYYRHEFKKGIIPVNLVFSVLRSTVPQVYFRNPSVVITPTKPGLEHELHARLVEDIDNWLLREISVKYELKKMIADAFLCGIGNGFVGYDSQFGFSQDKTVLGGAASLTQFDSKGNRIETNTNVNPGMPWFLRSRPEDTVYPWGCEDKNSAEWVAMRVFRPLQDLKKDKKYSNTNDLHGSHVQRRTTGTGTVQEFPNTFKPEHKDHDWVELWQVHDARTRKVLAVVMDHDKFLRNDVDLMQIEGLPVETLVFNADPDYIYGIPDARLIEPQLLELNEIRTQAMKHRRVDIAKLLYRKGTISQIELDKLLSEDVQAAVVVDADTSLKDAVMTLQPGASGILADLERAGEVVRGDVREMIGFSRTSTGEFQGKSHVTKAEVDVVQWANQLRLDERRDMVADLLTNVIRRFNQLIFSYWNEETVRSVIGPDGAKWWLKFTPSQIKGEYGIKVDPSNAIPVDSRTKRKDAIEMANAWAQMNMGSIKMGMPVPPEIQRYFFNQYDGINVDRAIAQSASMSQAAQAQQAAGPGGSPQQPATPGQAAGMMGR